MNKELYSKATQAAYDYRRVYGKFPDKIGIHRTQLHEMGCLQINFPVRNELKPDWFTSEKPDLDSVTYRRHTTLLEAIVGENVEFDEVYLPLPGKDTGDKVQVLSGKTIAKMADSRGNQRNERRRHNGICTAAYRTA